MNSRCGVNAGALVVFNIKYFTGDMTVGVVALRKPEQYIVGQWNLLGWLIDT
jgi:hypothetical protein